MKLSVERTQLAKLTQALQRYGKQIIKSEVLVLEAIDNCLILSVYSYEDAIKVKIRATIQDEGKIIINAKEFADVLREMDGINVILEIANQNLQITCGNFKMQLASVEYDLVFPEIDYKHKFDIHAEDFVEMVTEVYPAVGTNEIRPALMSICFDVKNYELNMVAIDGHRMAVSKTPIDTDEELIVPVLGKTLDQIKRILKILKPEYLTVCVDENEKEEKTRVILKTDNLTVITPVSDTEYPKWEAVIPEDFVTTVVIDCDRLIKAVKRLSVLIGKGKPIRCCFRECSLDLAVGDTTIAGEEHLEINFEGEKIKNIYFRADFLLDGLKPLKGEEIEFKLSGETTAALIKLVDNDEYQYVLMPMWFN